MPPADSAATTDMDLAPAKSRPRGDLFEGFNNLSLLRQAGLMIGLAASVAIGFAVVLWTQGEDYRPLYASLDRLDSSEVFDILDQHRIDYRIDSSTGALLVPAKDIHMARLRLAEVGIPGRRSVGFELMDQDQPLGTSQFVESTRYHRSIEGELARTITSIHSVRSARVHLAIPKRSVFVRDARKPTASVFVEVFPGRTVEPAQVTAIVNLVASSIAELVPEAVTVVDQRGNLLSKMEDNEDLLLADRQRAFTRRVEEQIASRVNGILEPILGADRYRAEVSADIDFTAVEQAAETFNPDLAAVRSEQILNESRDGPDFGVGIPGALTNQPPGTAEAPEQIDPETGQPVTGERPRNRREQATRNFELDRTISYTRHQQGRVQRLSVAVVVDDKMVMNEQGMEQREPWSAVELERMERLVRDAVGFSAARGDSVNVLNSPFRVRDIADMDVPEIPWWQEDWVLSYLKQGAGVLVILMLIFGLLRPVLKNLATTGGRISEEQEARELAALEAAGLSGYGGSSDETVTLTGGALGLPGPEEGYEQQLNAIKGLVADDPGRVAQVVKTWINKDE
jgi:flagellar M-ring protein FliF